MISECLADIKLANKVFTSVLLLVWEWLPN